MSPAKTHTRPCAAGKFEAGPSFSCPEFTEASNVPEAASVCGRRRGRSRRFGRCRCARVSAIDAGGHGDRSGSSPTGVVACASVEQMILPSLLALNADHRAIGGFHVGFSIKCYPDGKSPGLLLRRI
jgi:hypothetical protein